MSVECYIVYDKNRYDMAQDPVPEAYVKYGVRYVYSYVDSPDAVFVLPETRVHAIDEVRLGTAVVWWMSVDNYLLSYQSLPLRDVRPDYFSLRERENVYHFVQSLYAENFLKEELGIRECFFLGDYINEEISAIGKGFRDRVMRRPVCLFNPRKGFGRVKPVMEACGRERPDILWIALQGLTPREMAKLMCTARVYVDFGNHPGKDRIPREAAVCGCCILTNRAGSAGFADVDIPERYKIADTEDIPGVLEVLYDLVDNYELRKEEYKGYVAKIEGEKVQFERDVRQMCGILQKRIGSRTFRRKLPAGKYTELTAVYSEILGRLDGLLDGSALSGPGSAEKTLRNLMESDYMLCVLRQAIYSQASDIAEYMGDIRGDTS